MTTISIAMATYNGEPFIRQQLESLSQQSLLPSELIVCDDGSTDSTLRILSEFSRSAPFPVTIFENPRRLGFTANFLQAVRICNGDLIALCDQDDVWLPNKLRRILQATRESDALLIAHADEWIDRDGNSLNIVYPLDRRFQKYLQVNDFFGHSIVVRKSLLEMTKHSLTTEKYKEVAGDFDFGHDVLFLEVASAMNKVLFVPEVLVRWRVHSEVNHAWTNLLGTTSRKKVNVLDRIFPPDLSERYAEAAASYRRHSNWLSNVIPDLAAYGGIAAQASVKLGDSMKLMMKRTDVMELRSRFYEKLSRGERIQLMRHGAAMGQYRLAKEGGVGPHNALRDILAWLFLLPRK